MNGRDAEGWRWIGVESAIKLTLIALIEHGAYFAEAVSVAVSALVSEH